jgi:hypothetical protein
MLIKLTNNNEQLKGMPIYLMQENIMSVLEIPTDSGSLTTCVYGIRGDTWQVEEGLSEAVRIINGVIH